MSSSVLAGSCQTRVLKAWLSAGGWRDEAASYQPVATKSEVQQPVFVPVRSCVAFVVRKLIGDARCAMSYGVDPGINKSDLYSDDLPNQLAQSAFQLGLEALTFVKPNPRR